VRRTVTLALAAVLLLAGCTGEQVRADAPPARTTAVTPTPTPPRACELVTAAEAASALGLAADPTPTVDTLRECLYPGLDGVDSVNVVVRPEAYVRGVEEAAITALGAERTTALPGLGQAALVYDIGHQVQIHAWAGGQYLLVTVSRADGGGGLSGAARSLAGTAVTRIVAR